MVVRWPSRIQPDATPRSQFHHCNDIVPTIYEVIGITPPREVRGVEQQPLDGTSLAYTFDDADAEGRLRTQYFEIMGSRAIYHDGWMASAFGPRAPWVPGRPEGIDEWTPDKDTWELYHLDEDWTQANDLADQHPEKLAELKEVFAMEAARNSVYPIGGGLWVVVYHPELRISTPYREWTFTGDIVRMPEFCAPALGNRANTVTITADVPEKASGVLYALGANSGGLTCFLDEGHLVYEYNLFILQRTKIRSEQPLPTGGVTIEVETVYAEARPGGPLNVTVSANGEQVAAGQVPISAPLLFTANDCLDIGTCLGSPVSLDYFDRAPFPFEGTIDTVHVRYHA
jgi:arylsulfatase